MRAAFRDLHGASLHGFALLVALGDRRRAERAAVQALGRGMARAESLRHPERAAAWLRAAVLRDLRDARFTHTGARAEERRMALRNLGASDATIAGLARLSIRERAAIVAGSIERFELLDLETILGTSRSGVRRAIATARRRYLSVMLRLSDAAAPTGAGPVARKVSATAAQTLGTTAVAVR